MTIVFSEQCSKAHDKMPYRWEMRHDDQWTAMTDNEAIERDFCDPQNTHRYFLYSDHTLCFINPFNRKEKEKSAQFKHAFLAPPFQLCEHFNRRSGQLSACKL